MHETDKQREFIEFRAKGFSYRSIAKRIKVAKSTLCIWQEKLKTQISVVHNDELEDLYEEYRITTISRIKRLGELLNRLENELKTRDLSDVSTDKLIQLYTMSMNALRAEIPESKEITDFDVAMCNTELLD